eukprot:TRINITY_DN56826_c0_g1_i1.p1 TRINITY_DN56826_c0_g1~~TRINITY_DN56826_c0_g1_i1.p1  ORF type:complete len:177 (+),score=39.61 TRINITY_DN56826_c0_g1_i1:112-642(+)
MEIRCVEGCIDFDSDLKASQQLVDGWDEQEFLRETKTVFARFSRNGVATKEDIERWLKSTKFREKHGRDRVRPCEVRVEVDATFRELDLHGNGYITLKEFRAYHRQRFENAVRALQEEERLREEAGTTGEPLDETVPASRDLLPSASGAAAAAGPACSPARTRSAGGSSASPRRTR